MFIDVNLWAISSNFSEISAVLASLAVRLLWAAPGLLLGCSWAALGCFGLL